MSTPSASRSTCRLPCRRPNSRLSRAWRLTCTLPMPTKPCTATAFSRPRMLKKARVRLPKGDHRNGGGADHLSVVGIEKARGEPADFRAGVFADVGAGAQVLGAVRPLPVPVRVVAGEHDEVVAEHVDDAGQNRFFGLARHEDVAGLQVLLRIALPAMFDPVAALFEVLVQAVDEERHPAHARLEEGHP